MTSAATPAAAERLHQLAHDYWEGILRRTPTLATFFGDYRYNDRLENIGPEGRAEEAAELRSVLERLHAIPQDELPTDDAITWDMLRLSAEASLDGLRLRLDEMHVDQMQGPQVWLLELLNWHPTDTREHVDQLIARYRAFPRYMRQYLGNLRDGVRDGRTAPHVAAERVIVQLNSLLATPPEQSPLAAPATRAEGSPVAPEQADALRRAIRDDVYPAYQRMLDFLADEYLEAHARRDPGVWAVTDGEEIYQLLARQHTTTSLTPRELHEIGLEELNGIHREMRAIMQRHGDTSGDVRAFTKRLVEEPTNLPTSSAEIVQLCEGLLAEAQAALPRAFGRLPTIPCLVKPIEEYRERDAPAAYYYQPADDGSRPGIFYVNTYEPASRPKHTLPALVFHEGVPGHHLQIALSQETRDLPAFRRLGAGWLSNAYVEGWALYTERLADELGLYPDDPSTGSEGSLARFGMLGYQAWRACRLVVDTGIHHLRWSRQQGIDFFLDNVGLSELETLNEVDRYIIWPAQALSYKVGQREIEALRREARERLGDRFDLRAFHDELLRHGATPLSTLRSVMGAWASAQH